MEVRLKIDLADKTQRDLLNQLFDAIAGVKQETKKDPVKETKKDPVKETKKDPVKEIKLTLNEVRTAIAKKAPTHRAEVVAKLKEFGAKNATTLPEENYAEYVAYLETL